MNAHTIYKTAIRLFLGSALSVSLNSATAVVAQAPAQLPLSVGTAAVPPNIMLMVDSSGSMGTSFQTGALTLPSAMPSTATYNCSNPVSGGTTSGSAVSINMKVSSTKSVQFCVSKTTTTTTNVQTCTGTGRNKKCTTTPTTTTTTDPCGTLINFGNTSTTTQCFNNNQYYNAVYYQGSTLSGGPFLGANLNWYFSTHFFNVGSLSPVTVSTTRIQMAKDAAHHLVDSLTPAAVVSPATERVTVRLGLSSYNGNNGGTLRQVIDDLTNAKATSVGTAIDAISANGNTPLAETLVDIGRYFATGETGSLTLHANMATCPLTSPLSCSASVNSIFDGFAYNATSSSSATVKGLLNSTGTTVNAFIQNTDGTKNTGTSDAPIQKYCQKNAVILVSDGLPNQDRDVSSVLRDYSGDCATKSLCDATPNARSFPGPSTPIVSANACANSGSSTYNQACQNGSKVGRAYESGGSDYLDDVAQALYEMDLRPSFPNKPTGLINNLKTYAIGISDPVLQSDSVLRDAALRGGGSFEYADDYNKLVAALDRMVADIQKNVGSFSAIVANSSQLGTDSALFQAKYDTADWTGDFLALPLDSTGGVLAYNWDAGETGHIPAWASRNIFTYKDSTTKGVTFSCTNLSTVQKNALGITTSCANTDTGVWRLNWVRGDTSHEQVNAAHASTYNASSTPADPRAATATTTNNIFRNRARFWQDTAGTHVADTLRQDPWLLGDIVNSDAVYVSNENYGYGNKGFTESSSYGAFITAKGNWRKMLYIGANDGMLHGVDASLNSGTYTTGGNEVFTYLPNAVFAGLQNLSSPAYSHQYFVDGSPKAGDVYYNSAWHTALVGSTGAGGKGVFALDVSDPDTFSASDVLWEIDDTTTGFGDMGYTLPQSSIVKMNDGSWAAIIANGYASSCGKAVLYVVNIQTGAIIKTLDTTELSATCPLTTPNGLSTPIAADVNADGKADVIYAGDLLGNMWKFDVSSTTVSNWDIAYKSGTTPLPLFTACLDATNATTCNVTRQPITNKPQVGKVSTAQSIGTMVYFGTGKYYEDIDNTNTNTQTQSFYGIWDKCPLISAGTRTCSASVSKSTLLQQEIVVNDTSANVRVTSDYDITYPDKTGWFMDFVDPVTDLNDGERIVSASLLRGGRIVFVTLLPIPVTTGSTTDPCKVSSASTSWLMELDAISGSRLSYSVLDVNKNGSVDDTDKVSVNVAIDGSGKSPVSGIKMENGSTKTPAVLTNPGHDEIKYVGSSAGANPVGIAETPAATSNTGASRQSWREIIPQ